MYSYTPEAEIVGKARLEGADASYKDLVEICSNIKGKRTDSALLFLEKVVAMEAAVHYKKYIKGLGHRKELCGKPGRYPKKEAKIVLGVLKSAIASAKGKGLSEDLVILHASANKKNSFLRMSPKGKRVYSNYETARVEIIVHERMLEEKADELNEKDRTLKTGEV